MNGIKILNYKNVHSGLNKSLLKILGYFNCRVYGNNNTEVEIKLLVVDNGSANYNVLLGRDFINKSNKIKLLLEGHDATLKSKGKLIIANCDQTTKLRNEWENHWEDILAIELENDKANLNIGENNIRSNRERLQALFTDVYEKMERPAEAKVQTEMKLVLKDEKPFNCPPRRLAYAEREKLQIILDEYTKSGIIRPSELEYASPIGLVKKKDGGIRMCIDYRKLNSITAKRNDPIPIIDDLVTKLKNKLVFTKLDLKNGYYHVKMHRDSV